METYVVELDRTEPDCCALTVPALPGLLILGTSVDEVLKRAQAAIEFRCAMPFRDPPGRPRVVLLSAQPLATERG